MNDNAPVVVGGSIVRLAVDEGHTDHLSASVTLSLTDVDDWSLGHGPPFTVRQHTTDARIRLEMEGEIQLTKIFLSQLENSTQLWQHYCSLHCIATVEEGVLCKSLN